MKLYKYNKSTLQYEYVNIPINFLKTLLGLFSLQIGIFFWARYTKQQDKITNVEQLIDEYLNVEIYNQQIKLDIPNESIVNLDQLKQKVDLIKPINDIKLTK